MAIARFFERNYAAAGAALSISRDALERTLAARTIGLLCGPDVEGDANARWTAEMTVALLARLYPTLSLEAPPAFADALTALAVAINPLIEIVRGGDIETAIVVGERRSPLPPNAIFTGARGWVAHVARTPVPVGGPENPYSAGAAGCIAVGEAFRQVFRASLRPWVEPRDIALSLLDYGPGAGASLPLHDVDLSEVAFFGLGAVANGALWALGRHRALRGVAWLIDAETVDPQTSSDTCSRWTWTRDVARRTSPWRRSEARGSNHGRGPSGSRSSPRDTPPAFRSLRFASRRTTSRRGAPPRRYCLEPSSTGSPETAPSGRRGTDSPTTPPVSPAFTIPIVPGRTIRRLSASGLGSVGSGRASSGPRVHHCRIRICVRSPTTSEPRSRISLHGAGARCTISIRTLYAVRSPLTCAASVASKPCRSHTSPRSRACSWLRSWSNGPIPSSRAFRSRSGSCHGTMFSVRRRLLGAGLTGARAHRGASAADRGYQAVYDRKWSSRG